MKRYLPQSLLICLGVFFVFTACVGQPVVATPPATAAPTSASTDTPVPPTDTPVPPTDTPVPPTDTPLPPTATPGARGPVRIAFAPGATTWVTQGSLQPQATDRYVLRAVAGQTMSVNIVSPSGVIQLAITGVTNGEPYKRTAVGSPNFSFVLPITQDYYVDAVNEGAAASTYTLEVIIPPAATQPSPVRIQFAAGATSAVVEGSLQPQETDRYVLKAMAGQTMAVTITSSNATVLLAVTGSEDGQPYKRIVDDSASFTFVLPNSQDYILDAVNGGSDAATYSMRVEIQ